MPTYLEDLPTPCVLIEQRRLHANIEQMQAKANAQGVALRPHTKTHKSVAVAQRQVKAGAVGLTVAKVGEAEVYADHGFKDIRLAYTTVGDEKHERIAALLQHGVRASFCVDTPEGADAASAVYAAHGLVAEVLMEVDVEYGRCGVPWNQTEDAVELANHIAALPGLTLMGLLTHAGQSYHGPHDGATKAEALRAVSIAERDRILAVASALRAAGHAEPDHFEISIGSTPSMRYFENAERDGFRITEIRPGTYVYFDAQQVNLGAARLQDCALSVLTSVISKRRDANSYERLFVDAGKKVLTSDQGYGLTGYGTLLYNARVMTPLPHAEVVGLSEEHGWIRVRGGATLDVGDRVRLVPNHACVVVNTQPHLYLVDGDEVISTLTVDAQGAVR
ncbi:MAG: D-TA family PLP-dependent enzyme [Rhodothermales bacterium]